MQMLQRLKTLFIKVIVLLILTSVIDSVRANTDNYLTLELLSDSTKKSKQKTYKSEDKAERKRKKAAGKKLLKDTHSRFLVKYDYVFANLKTRVTVNGPYGILNLSLSLEDNLGLPSRASFSSLAFVYRATLRSGLYANYYGINRNEDFVLEQDIIYDGDTIAKSGVGINTYFNTQIVSAGYMFSALIKPDAYLGFYANLYVISLKTGFDTKNESRSAELVLTMPLPNFGFVASFRLTKWLLFYGSVGVFSLNTNDLPVDLGPSSTKLKFASTIGI